MSTASVSLPIRSCTSGTAAPQQRLLLLGRRVGDELRRPAGRAPSGAAISSTESSRMCEALIASHFLRSKRAGLGLTRPISNACTISSRVKTSRSSAIAQPSSAM